MTRKKHNKISKLWYVAGVLAAVAGISLAILFGYTYQVSGAATDRLSGEPLKGVSVSIGDRQANTDQEGKYSIEGIRMYERKDLTVGEAEGYLKHDPIAVAYDSRQVRQDVTLSPDLKKTVEYVNELRSNDQFSALWDLLHPDEQKYWKSKEEYATLFENAVKPLKDLGAGSREYKLGTSPRKLATWKSELTGSTYENVDEYPVEVSVVALGIPVSDNQLQHYLLVDGVYKFFGTSTRQQLEESARGI